MEDATQYGSNFLNVFNQILDVHAPMTEIKQSKKQRRQNAKPWITNNILKLIRAKDKTYHQLIKESNATKKESVMIKYKEQKNEITKQIRRSKKFYYNQYFTKNSSNLKNFGLASTKYSTKTNILTIIQYVLKLM